MTSIREIYREAWMLGFQSMKPTRADRPRIEGFLERERAWRKRILGMTKPQLNRLQENMVSPQNLEAILYQKSLFGYGYGITEYQR